MKIYRPIKTNYISQNFGEDLACSNGDKIINKPPSGCPLGYKSLYASLGMDGHNGTDFAGVSGEAIYHCADFDGIVKTHKDGNGGIGIDVISQEPLLDGEHVKLRHWHLSKVADDVYDGKVVKMGDLIGYVGSTGLSSAPHDHMGLKPCDKNGTATRSNNGFYGAISPEPYFENVFVLDKIKITEYEQTLITLLKRLVFLLQQKLNSLIK